MVYDCSAVPFTTEMLKGSKQLLVSKCVAVANMTRWKPAFFKAHLISSFRNLKVLTAKIINIC